MMIYRFVTPALAVASMDLMAPSLSTAFVLSGLPPPAPAAQITVLGFVCLMVETKSSTVESSMLWTMGLPPRDWMSDFWSGFLYSFIRSQGTLW